MSLFQSTSRTALLSAGALVLSLAVAYGFWWHPSDRAAESDREPVVTLDEPARQSLPTPLTISDAPDSSLELSLSSVETGDQISGRILARDRTVSVATVASAGVTPEPVVNDDLIARSEAEMKLLMTEFDANLTNPAIRQLLSAELAVISSEYKAAVLDKVKRALADTP